MEIHGAIPFGSDSLSHALHLREDCPDTWEKAAALLEPADFLTTVFTGEIATNLCTAFAFLLTIPLCLYSDRTARRAPPLLLVIGMGAAGYIILMSTTNTAARYAGTFLAATGAFAGSALNIPWLSNNVRGHTRRATASALQLAVGQFGGVASAYVYPVRTFPCLCDAS